MLQQQKSSDELFLRLAYHAAYLENVFTIVGQGKVTGLISARDIAKIAGVSSSRLPALLNALRAAEEIGLISQDACGLWKINIINSQANELALMLRGSRLYREKIHSDQDTVQVVISKPAEPSKLVSSLEKTLEGTWGLKTTENILGDMAVRAKNRFTIMTPFIDDDGANRIIELFSATSESTRRELIVRDGLPDDLKLHSDKLNQLGVLIFDFRIPRLKKMEAETFHAKVVRVDTDECYVGSSNMTKWSFDYSLELGFHVTGQAGAQISRVIDAILEVSGHIEI